jgi:hypothetical protein
MGDNRREQDHRERLMIIKPNDWLPLIAKKLGAADASEWWREANKNIKRTRLLTISVYLAMPTFAFFTANSGPVIATDTVAAGETFPQWLFSAAGAGWALGIVSLFGLIVTIVRRTRPGKLVFAEIDKTSLIDINSRIRDRIRVTYNEQPIARLGHVRAEIFNEGSETIHNAVLELKMAEEVRILEITVVSSDGSSVECKHDGHRATISVGYINPFRDHQHTLLLSMLVDGEIPKIEVGGGGDGWSLRRVTEKNSPPRHNVAFLFFFVLLIIWVFLSLFYINYVESHYGIGQHEHSLRSFLASMVVLVPLSGIIYGLYWASTPRRAKTSKETLEKFRNA